MKIARRTNPKRTQTTMDPRWALVVARDAAADAKFVYAVKTTGIYCKPSSASKLPKPRNVVFFDSATAAEAAGYRPSFAADQTSKAVEHARIVTAACRRIETEENPPRLDVLARQAGMSSFHFHRVFKEAIGLTPRAYAAAHRARRMREQLQARNTRITDAIYGSGFNSNSRFYEASDGVLGMPAKDYRAGGANTTIKFAVGECSLGSILVAQSRRGVCAILLGGDPEKLVRDLENQFPNAELIGADRAFEKLVAKVVGFIEAPRKGLKLPLDVQGTAFQVRVWQALRKIPAGTTVSYTDLAKHIGMPRAVRAVAQACAANRLAVAIPCHRVVRRDGDISGYRWGVERKRELLQRESRAGAFAEKASDVKTSA
jgi:AraC family transcriptional regulator, regulatory protein of adaptative response / methylated-DNA-[protein]-cysteine methyltransferase